MPRNPLGKPRRGKEKTPTPVSWSLAKNLMKLTTQAKNTVFFMVNAVILQTVAKIDVLLSISTKRKRKKFQDLQKEKEGAKSSN